MTAGLFLIDVDQLDLEEGRRTMSDDAVKVFASSIESVGLQMPILVARKPNGRFIVRDGRHRTRAALLLGWLKIPAIARTDEELDAALGEIDSDLINAPLTQLDRALILRERKQLYEARYPETRNGGDRKSAAYQENQNEKISFCSDASEKLGLGARSIEQAIKLANGLSDVSIRRIRGSELADRGSELKQLSNQDAGKQAKILDLVLAAESDCRRVGEAIDRIEGRTPIRSPKAADRKFSTFETLWSRAGKKLRSEIIGFIERQTGGRFVLPDGEA